MLNIRTVIFLSVSDLLKKQSLDHTEQCSKHLIGYTYESGVKLHTGTGLKPIGPFTLNWAPRLIGPMLELSTHGCISTHSNTMQLLQRPALGPTPPKLGPDLI